MRPVIKPISPVLERYFQRFIKKIIITLPKVEIVAKPEVILAVLENKTAVRTDGVHTAVSDWLPNVVAILTKAYRFQSLITHSY